MYVHIVNRLPFNMQRSFTSALRASDHDILPTYIHYACVLLYIDYRSLGSSSTCFFLFIIGGYFVRNKLTNHKNILQLICIVSDRRLQLEVIKR